MSSTNHACANQLKHLVYYNLDLNLLDTALFMAGRLLAYEPRASEAAYLVALCNLRLHRYKLAYEHSKTSGTRGTHIGCAYVFAQACLSLGSYQEGAHALERLKAQWKGRNNWGKHTDTRRHPLPDAAAILCLLGHLHRAMEDGNKASEYFSESLKLNPFMWEAFTALCDLGVNVRTSKIFVLNQEMLSTGGSSEDANTFDEAIPVVPVATVSSAMSHDPFTVSTSRANTELKYDVRKATLSEKLNGAVIYPVVNIASDGFETPPTFSATVSQVKDVSGKNSEIDPVEPYLASLRRRKALMRAEIAANLEAASRAPPRMKASIPKFRKLQIESDEVDTSGAGTIMDRKRTVSGHPTQSGPANATANVSDPSAPTARRSVRILNSSTARPQSRTAGAISAAPRDVRDLRRAKPANTKPRANPITVGRVVSGNRKHDPLDNDNKEARYLPAAAQHGPRQPAENSKDSESLQILLELFRTLASGYFSLSQFRCQDALKTFNSLSLCQRDTPWVLLRMAKANFELSSWAESEKLYLRVRTIAPAALEDLDYYSTVLWHQKKDVELSFLAHEIMDLDRLSPQAWLITGNSLSLQKDHEGALKCFKRATQLDPKFEYAYTLQGHEHITGEEYDKALEAYRTAVAVNPRHYNSWYGLGKVFERQGRFETAEGHYRIAATINPSHAVLVCCIGIVLEKMKKVTVALGWYNRATEMAPRQPMARYKKSRALISMGEYRKAMVELLVLKDITPEDANVHFLLGKCHAALRDRGTALRHYTCAMNLDPKVSLLLVIILPLSAWFGHY